MGIESFIERFREFKFRSLRFRLAALFAVLLAFSLIVIGTVLFGQFIATQRMEFDRNLYNHAVDVAHGINVGMFGDLSFDVDSLSGKDKIFPFAIGRSFLQITTLEGRIIGKSGYLGTDRLPLGTAQLKDLLDTGHAYQTLNPDTFHSALIQKEMSYRQISLLVNPSGHQKFVLQVAVPLAFLQIEKNNLLNLFWIMIPLALGLSLFGAVYFSGRALVPIQLIIKKARSLDPRRLDERLPVPPVKDELRDLSVTLNGLLDRIQKAFRSQERFITDASHQLKTPLAIVRGELDLALQKPRSPDETRVLLLSFSQELQYLSKTIDNLLTLARVDAGDTVLTQNPVRLDEAVMDAISRHERIARKKNLTIKMDLKHQDGIDDNPFVVMGDATLIESMIGEILDNAVKYSPEGKLIQVQLSSVGGTCFVEVKDSGPGIPEDDRDKIFDRFYRASGSVKSGSGLGLAIAKKIAEAHQGAIEFFPTALGGSGFRVQIKKL